MAAPAPAAAPDAAKVEYARRNNVHHLFELLAHKVLNERPDNLFAFLHDQLTRIERENSAPKHDPTVSIMGVNVVVLGLQNAGKTAIIASMGGEPNPNTQPTIGFTPHHYDTEQMKLCVFDLGGGKSFRGIWPHYFHDAFGIIYVVDASDRQTLDESITAFDAVVNHKYVSGKPVLLLANKRDVPGALTAAEIAFRFNALRLGSSNHRVLPTCAIRQDSELDNGVEWLLGTIQTQHTALAARCKADSEEVKVAKAKALEEQRKRVEADRQQREQAAAAAAAAAAATTTAAAPKGE